MTTHFVSCTCGAFLHNHSVALTLSSSQPETPGSNTSNYPGILPHIDGFDRHHVRWHVRTSRSSQHWTLLSSNPKQHKQSMSVKGGSAYYDKQHMLCCASCCNDGVMLRSLTRPHTLWRPFMTKLIDSHMHSNKDN